MLTGKSENILQVIIDSTLCSASQQKEHKLTSTKKTRQIIIGRTKGGRSKAREDNLVGQFVCQSESLHYNDRFSLMRALPKNTYLHSLFFFFAEWIGKDRLGRV
jgi:hypothetical protein